MTRKFVEAAWLDAEMEIMWTGAVQLTPTAAAGQLLATCKGDPFAAFVMAMFHARESAWWEAPAAILWCCATEAKKFIADA
jgi:hypothetical protein